MQNLNQNDPIKCPNCGNFMDINELLYIQISNQVQEEFQKQKQEFQNEVNKQKIEYAKALNDLKVQKADQEKLINERVSQELLLQKQKIQQDFLMQKQNFQKEFSEKFHKEHESEVKIMQEELDQKSKELSQLLSVKAENEKLKREQKENEERLKFQIKEEALKEFKEQENKNLELQKQKIRLEYEEKEMAHKELQIQFNTVKQELDVLKRKADQGSQQLQGEAAELFIQEYIQKEYLSDEVKEVPKGISGADCLHVVKDNFGNICGSILYEIKRTKEFNKEWLDKLKLDSIAARSDIAVLITKTMPKEREKTHFKEGILVCTFFEFKGVLAVLRESIMNIYKLKNALKNKDEKNHILYEYLNSKEFNTQITFILKTYQNMKEELEAEKRALQNIWKKREKAIENLSFNSTAIVSSLNAIFSDLKGENLIGEDGLRSLENLAKED
ncbi:DUF2130 domain-containing protein [Campylobacter sp. VicNov18]|uniref:DUF2130 domain-containing protein n=1 Tax=Campylobacter bilis TaxID=2691918 RepID=UPI00130DB6A6|nr:DUF2130 domain-containing protein [Campylobacter bilis]MPV63086.1 DUF2130 domain-containing protein [Campylobacter hepaticus]MBM0636585.1 DUF2130 domain-containing protein [Campylobacter bilis]MCC8277293.1 DUF2130 domain-containing protein [Campylobacter bilis]MCC8299036.1 DUF2130 domain-containing protein [Campylobacter bilis]MCC8300202.1 DUF2130 domain-containing protein [Campylobacter bilis]